MHGYLSRCRPLDVASLRDVMSRARARDVTEYRALTGSPLSDDIDHAAQGLVDGSRWGAVVTLGGYPEAALGAFASAIPGVWVMWLHATDAWPLVWRDAYRWAREILRPAMLASPDVRRAQALVVGGEDRASRFLGALGMTAEAPMRALCTDGQDAVMWRAVR